MGLFRNTDSLGVIDNYNTLVMPRLEQQQRNAAVSSGLRGLQTTARNQAAVIQRIGENTQRLSGTRNPSYYMNLGGYYPGLQQK